MTSQLHSAIKGLYGQINAEEYLSKFLHVTLTLPKELNLNYLNNDDNTKYCRVVLSRHGYLPADEFTDKWAILIGALATSFGMSLREIERCVSLYTLCNFTTQLSVYTAWPIFLKIKKPAIFQGIKNSTQSSNQDAADLLSPLCTEDNQMKHFFERLVELHKVCAQAKDLHSTRDFNLGGAAPYEHGFHSWSELLPYYCRLIECSV